MSIPSVSVIIANYNRAEMLKEALQSVVDQSYEDFEVIVVDDGSEDHSLEVIETFHRQDPDRIKLFTHEDQANNGIQATYQLGISQARGEYVAFLDHDDRWTPNYLGSKVKILSSNPEIGVVFSPYKVVGDGWFGRDMTLRQWLLKSTIRKDRSFSNLETMLKFNNVATFSCFVARRDLLAALPSPAEQTLLFDWWVLVLLSTRSLFYYDTSSLTYWRWSKQSTMGKQAFEELKETACRAMEQMYAQIAEDANELSDSDREVFETYQAIFPYFLSYYRHPGLLNLAKFFRRSPFWAMASMLSLVINYFKFR